MSPAPLTVAITLALAGCGGSSGGGSPADDAANGGTGVNIGGGVNTGSGTDTGAVVPVIEGDIARFGVVNVADDGGEASDAIAAFYAATPSVGAGAFGSALDPAGASCTVDDASSGGNDVNLLVFVPTARGAQTTSIDAGETVTLSSAAGTWMTLTGGMASGFTFYSAPVPDGAVPDALVADVAAASDADGFAGVAQGTLPAVQPLTGFGYGSSGNISASSTFTWDAGSDPAARVRLVSSTAGAFFSGSGVRVACLVPDTGSFSFPADVREQIGADFDGEPPFVSRVAIATEQQGDSVLFLIRESFVD